MTILALDTFQRANSSPNWGSASDVGGSWTGNANTAISNNQGTYSGVTSAIALFATGAANSADAEVLIRVTTGNTGDLIAAIVRKTATTTYYYGGFTAANTVAIFKNVTGTTTSLASAAFTWSAGTSYWMRFQVQSTNLLLKVWADGTAEPTTWNVTTTNSDIAGAGGIGMRLKPAAATSDTIAVDHFTSDDLTYAFGTDALTSSDSLVPTLADLLSDTALTCSDSASTFTDVLAQSDTLSVSDSSTFTLTGFPGGAGDTLSASEALNATQSVSDLISLAADSFTRADQSPWGLASDAVHTWNILSPPSGSANTSIVSNEGKFVGSLSNLNAQFTTISRSDPGALVRFALSSASDSAWIVLRALSANTHYRFRYFGTTGNVSIASNIAGVVTSLGNSTFALSANTFYWLRASAINATLSLKIWQDGTAEPSAWTLQITDTSIAGNGALGLGALLGNVSNSVLFDSFQAFGYAPEDILSTDDSLSIFTLVDALQDSGDSLTVQDLSTLASNSAINGFDALTASESVTFAQSVNFQVPLAADSFARANQIPWGLASDGVNTWAIISGGNINTSVFNNEGEFTNSTNTLNAEFVGLTDPDPQAMVRFALSSTSDSAWIVLRATNNSTHYRFRYFGTTGKARIDKNISGTVTNLTSVNFTLLPNAFYWLRGSVVGTTLSLKIWQDGNAEPSAWTLQITDTSIAGSGAIGVGAILGNAANTVLFDHFFATGNPAENLLTPSEGFPAFAVTDMFGDAGDTLTASELTLTTTLNATPVDALSSSDLLQSALACALADAAVVSDAALLITLAVAQVVDTLSVSDLALAATLGLNALDQLALAETLALALSETYATDTLSASELFTPNAGMNALDQLALAETLALALSETYATDTLAASELFTPTLAELQTDTLSASEVVTVTLAELQTDTLSASEVVTVTLAELQTDTLSASDALAWGRAILYPADTVTVSDAGSLFTVELAPVEALSILDSVSTFTVANRLADAGDTLSAQEQFVPNVVLAVTDALSVLESLQSSITSLFVFDLAVASDAPSVFTVNALQTDTLATSELFIPTSVLAPVEQLTEVETLAASFAKSFVDALTLQDVSTTTVNALQTDTLATSELFIPTSVLAPVEQLTEVETLVATSVLAPVDQLLARETLSPTLAALVTDALSASELFIPATGPNAVDTLSASDLVLAVTLGLAPVDQLTEVETLVATVAYALTVDLASAQDSLLQEALTVFSVDTLTELELFATSVQHNVIQLIGRVRDGVIVGTGRG